MDQSQRRTLARIVNVKDWVAKPLTGFMIEKLTEVYGCNEDGRSTESLGYFKNPMIAAAFASQQSGHAYWSCRTREVHVLTNGTIGFLLDTSEPVELIDDEAELLRIKEKAVAKLSDAERRVLGFRYR